MVPCVTFRSSMPLTWTCPKCGEVIEDNFDTCWRCGAEAPRHAAREDVSDAELVAIGEAEDAKALAELEHREWALEAYEDRAGWHPAISGYRGAAADAGLHRLIEAYRIYRRRHAETARPERADLDRRWTLFAISLGLTGGIVAALFMDVPWMLWVMDDETRFLIVWGGAMLATVITGHRAVKAELRAEAEYQVSRGYSGPPAGPR